MESFYIAFFFFLYSLCLQHFYIAIATKPHFLGLYLRFRIKIIQERLVGKVSYCTLQWEEAFQIHSAYHLTTGIMIHPSTATVIEDMHILNKIYEMHLKSPKLVVV